MIDAAVTAVHRSATARWGRPRKAVVQRSVKRKPIETIGILSVITSEQIAVEMELR